MLRTCCSRISPSSLPSDSNSLSREVCGGVAFRTFGQVSNIFVRQPARRRMASVLRFGECSIGSLRDGGGISIPLAPMPSVNLIDHPSSEH